MKTVFDDQRNQIPVTVLELKPNFITQIKTVDRDGYQGVQIGYRETKERRLTKPLLGHLKKSGVVSLSKLAEFRTDDIEKYKLGDSLTVEQFSEGEIVTVSAVSKGRGFAGVVKRYNFKGGPKTHGQSDRLRARGSIGASSEPSKVVKGMRMAGQMGNVRITVKNLEVVNVDKDKNILLVKGSVPGSRNTFVEVQKR